MTFGPLVLTLGLLASWTVLGLGVMALVSRALSRPDRRKALGLGAGLGATALASPVVGMAILALILAAVSHAGAPLGQAAIWITLACAPIMVIGCRAAWLSRKRCLPGWVGAMLGAAFIISPTAALGWGWIGQGNDDMANYCLAALRFRDHGFDDAPDVQAIINGRDWPGIYWLMHVQDRMRAGSELLVAWCSGLTGRSPVDVFPCILAVLHGALVAGIAAVAAVHHLRRRTAWIAVALALPAPLMLLGADYQLIAQVAGLGLLTIGLAGLLTISRSLHRDAGWRHPGIALWVFALAGMLTIYPEMLPFLALPSLTVAFAALYDPQTRTQRARRAWWTGCGLTIIAILVASPSLISGVSTLLLQASNQKQEQTIALFPYFLVPSGLPTYWGITGLAVVLPAPWNSLAIVLALVVFAWLTCMIWQHRKRAPALVMTICLMIILAILFFIRSKDFSLFKLAMFSLPVTVALSAISVTSFKNFKWRMSALILLLTIQLPGAYRIMKLHLGGESSMSGIRSQQPTVGAVLTAVATHADDTIWCPSLPLAKLAMVQNGGQGIFAGNQWFHSILFGHPRVGEYSRLADCLDRRASVNSAGVTGETLGTTLHRAGSRLTLIQGDAPLNADSEQGRIVVSGPDDDHPRLAQVILRTAQHFYLGQPGSVAFYQLQPDIWFPGQLMSAAGGEIGLTVQGGKMLAQHPSMQLVTAWTATTVPNSDRALPNLTILGADQRMPIRSDAASPTRYYGAGQWEAPLPVPVWVDGLPLWRVVSDIQPACHPTPPTGLDTWYGTGISLDARVYAYHLRRMWLSSPVEPTAGFARWPDDLMSVNARYLGLYEDGWAGPSIAVRLHGEDVLTIAGQCPGIPELGGQMVTITVDGHEASRRAIAPGEFMIRCPWPGGTRLVELNFSKNVLLPKGDGRRASVKLDCLSLVAREE